MEASYFFLQALLSWVFRDLNMGHNLCYIGYRGSNSFQISVLLIADAEKVLTFGENSYDGNPACSHGGISQQKFERALKTTTKAGEYFITADSQGCIGCIL